MTYDNGPNTNYTVLSLAKLKTHNLCPERDEAAESNCTSEVQFFILIIVPYDNNKSACSA